MSSPTHIDEALNELEVLRTLTDEQLLEKYSSCFNFEKDFRDAIDSGRIKLSAKVLKGEEDEDSDETPSTAIDTTVEEATKRILEKKKAKEAAKKNKKKIDEEALKKMLLEDEELLKNL